jgi:hypothetical protein
MAGLQRRRFPAAGALALCAACSAGDASIELTWSIDGEAADVTVCEEAGAAWVQVVEDEDDDGTVDREFAQMLCSRGTAETASVFESDSPTHIAFLLGAYGGEILARHPRAGFVAFNPEPGGNDIEVDFSLDR